MLFSLKGDMMIAAALIMEASTPFVSLRSILSQLKGMRYSKIYVLNGIAMVVAFFICRILIYPVFYTIYGKFEHSQQISGTHAVYTITIPNPCHLLVVILYFVGMQRNVDMFQAILRTPLHCSFWMVTMLLPQLYWFRIMFIGALKVARENQKYSGSTQLKDILNKNSNPPTTEGTKEKLL